MSESDKAFDNFVTISAGCRVEQLHAAVKRYGDHRFRDGLAAACRVACWRCGEGHAVTFDGDEWMHLASMGIDPEPCEAAPIRRLIEQGGKDAQTKPTT